MSSIYTVLFLKDWSNGVTQYKRGDRITLPEELGRELVKEKIVVITGNKTKARERAVVPPTETR